MKVKSFDVIIERGEDGWLLADVPALTGCHTQGKTKKELLKNVKEAIELNLEILREKKIKNNSPFVGVEKVKVYA